MSGIRKTLRFVVAATTIVGLQIGATQAIADPNIPPSSVAQLSWKTPISTDFASDQPFKKLWVTQGFQGGMPLANVPKLIAETNTSPETKKIRFCDEVDSNCLPDSSWSAWGYGFFQLCETSSVAPCISGLEYMDKQGQWQRGELVHEADLSVDEAASRSWMANNSWGEPGTTLESVQTKWGWKQNAAFGLPGSGKGPLVFKFPGRSNAANEETYALDANFSITAKPVDSKKISVAVNDFNFQIAPVKEVTCDNRAVSVAVILKSPTRGLSWGQTGGSCLDPALYTTRTSAGFASKFAEDFPIRLQIAMPNTLSGWFQGRLESPQVEVTKRDASTSFVTITGQPTVIPATNKALDLSDPKNDALLGSSDFNWARQSQKNGYVGITGAMWEPRQGVGVLTKWLPFLDQKARGSISMWSISHFDSSSRCMNGTGGLQGLVTTNAMVYQPETPTFKNGELTYQVGGVHYDQDGQVVRGTYNFLMKRSVAQCLYGFSSAPISGSISVTSSDGETQVATTRVTDKDGWLRLTAEGFTFSTPTIKAKLSQANQPKSRTITCVKGKTIRKVTGLNPVCPAGFKKK